MRLKANRVSVERLYAALCLVFAPMVLSQSSTIPPGLEPLTLSQALERAAKNEPSFAIAKAEQKALALERTNARAALLPTATYHNQALYTEPNGVPTSRIGQTADAPAPIFIANNAVREYASLGVFSETLGLSQIGAIRVADANAAKAEAELEVARRGLVVTVTSLFYGVRAGAEKVGIAKQALDEAQHFVEITQERESAREAAHADVLKAQLLLLQRERELADAQLAAAKARLELAVLVYADPATPFALASEGVPVPLADASVIQKLAQERNPELRSAFASVQLSQAETYSTRTALLPNLALNFTYGIDATSFAVNGVGGIHNLGYSMSAQLDIPVWDWLSTERRIREAHLREDAVKTALTATQRRLVANLTEFYAEASAASHQMTSLNQTVDTAAESLRLTTLRYVDGESTVLEVVDAASTLSTAENAQIDGQTRYALALANLQTLTGVR